MSEVFAHATLEGPGDILLLSADANGIITLFPMTAKQLFRAHVRVRGFLNNPGIFVCVNVARDGSYTLSSTVRGPGKIVPIVGLCADYHDSIWITDDGGALDFSLGFAGGRTDPDATALIAAMSPAPSAGRQTLLRTTVASLKAAGLWAKMDAVWFLAAEAAQPGQLNWKNPATFALNPIASPTFTVDRGYAGNGTTSYLKTGFIPSVNGANAAQNAGHFSVFDNTERASVAVVSGGGGIPLSAVAVFPRYPTDGAYFQYMDNTSSVFLNTVRGLSVSNRSSATLRQGYRDGIQELSVTSAAQGFVSVELYLGANNNNGVVNSFTADQISFASIGGSLTYSEQQALDRIVYTYLKVVGAVTNLNLICCDGNSLTRGVQASSGRFAYPFVMRGHTSADGFQTALANTGISGQTTTQMIAGAPTVVDPLLNAYGNKKILVCWEILNDMYVGGVSAAQAVANMSTYIQARRAAGWQYIVLVNQIPTGPSGGTWIGGAGGSCATINALLPALLSPGVLADAIVDLSAVANLQNPANGTYFYTDQIHLIDAGYALVEAAVKPVVETFMAA